MTSSVFSGRIEKLGRDIDRRWRASGRKLSRLPEIATAALAEHAPHRGFSVESVIRWTLDSERFPKELNPFGDAVSTATLFSNAHFYISVYLYVDPQIAIHDHNFVGAFVNLAGNSLQTTFDFAPDEKVRSDLLIGDVKLREPRLIGPGEPHPIVAGNEFIHQVWHLSKPTVVLVVRTPANGTGKRNLQYRYWRPGLATLEYRHDFPGPEFPMSYRKRRAMLAFLRRAGNGERERLIDELVLTSDAWTGFYLMFENWDHFLARRDADALVDRYRKKHGSWARSVGAILDEADRYARVRWSKLDDEDLRFFVSLLFAFGERKVINEWIRRRFPDADPGALIVDWLRRLAEGEVLSTRLKEDHLALIEQALAGRADDEIARSMGDDDPEQEEAIRAACKKLRELPLLRPVLGSTG